MSRVRYPRCECRLFEFIDFKFCVDIDNKVKVLSSLKGRRCEKGTNVVKKVSW